TPDSLAAAPMATVILPSCHPAMSEQIRQIPIRLICPNSQVYRAIERKTSHTFAERALIFKKRN
ncbi:MAG: hypothetical protein ACK5JM_00095, partial [Rhodoblastus sp.]